MRKAEVKLPYPPHEMPKVVIGALRRFGALLNFVAIGA